MCRYSLIPTEELPLFLQEAISAEKKLSESNTELLGQVVNQVAENLIALFDSPLAHTVQALIKHSENEELPFASAIESVYGGTLAVTKSFTLSDNALIKHGFPNNRTDEETAPAESTLTECKIGIDSSGIVLISYLPSQDMTDKLRVENYWCKTRVQTIKPILHVVTEGLPLEDLPEVHLNGLERMQRSVDRVCEEIKNQTIRLEMKGEALRQVLEALKSGTDDNELSKNETFPHSQP